MLCPHDSDDIEKVIGSKVKVIQLWCFFSSSAEHVADLVTQLTSSSSSSSSAAAAAATLWRQYLHDFTLYSSADMSRLVYSESDLLYFLHCNYYEIITNHFEF